MFLTLLAQTADDLSTLPSAADAAAATAAAGGLAALAVGMTIFWVVIGGLSFVLWLWALIDVIRRNFTNPNDKILWLVLILLVPLGALIYLIVGRKNGTLPS